jgi:hypothetical protein
MKSADRPVKPLHMAHLENPAPSLGQIREFLCLLQGLGQGLFDEDVKVALQTVAGNGGVENRGDGDADGVHPAEYVPVILKCGHAQGFAQLLELSAIDVDDADQLDSGEFSVDPGVVLAYMPHPDDRHPYFPITDHRSPLTASSQ